MTHGGFLRSEIWSPEDFSKLWFFFAPQALQRKDANFVVLWCAGSEWVSGWFGINTICRRRNMFVVAGVNVMCDVMFVFRLSFAHNTEYKYNIFKPQLEVDFKYSFLFLQLNVQPSPCKIMSLQSLTLYYDYYIFLCSVDIWFEMAGLLVWFVTQPIVWKLIPVHTVETLRLWCTYTENGFYSEVEHILC